MNGGAVNNNSNLQVVNSTFYNNSATDSGSGIYNDDYMGGIGTMTLRVFNSTFSNNSAPAIYHNGNIMSIKNSILANSVSGVDCYNNGKTVIDSINNLIENNAASPNECGTPALTSNPTLGPLVDNGGLTKTMALLPNSPAIDAGDNSTCSEADAVNNLDQRGAARPYGSHCDIGAYELKTGKQTFKSQGKNDGWVLEQFETSGKGGIKNSSSKVFYVGDDAYNRQYRGILSFNTNGIPDNPVITSVKLKVKKAGLVGRNPFSTHKGLRVDIRKSKFGTSPKLQISDFQAKASKNLVGKFSSKAVSKWYTANLGSAAYTCINKTSTTQFRLRFYKDDNNDFGADYFKFYSGNVGLSSRPQLIVEYYVP